MLPPSLPTGDLLVVPALIGRMTSFPSEAHTWRGE